MTRTLDIEIPAYTPSIVMRRTFRAPRELVFDAWTKPEHARRWWGCKESELTVCEIDFRVGGAWRIVIRMPGHGDHPFHGVYREIARPERLVFTECYDQPAIGSPEWLTTVELEAVDGGAATAMTMTMLHASIEARDGHVRSGLQDGAAETMDRLAELVEQE